MLTHYIVVTLSTFVGSLIGWRIGRWQAHRTPKKPPASLL